MRGLRDYRYRDDIGFYKRMWGLKNDSIGSC